MARIVMLRTKPAAESYVNPVDYIRETALKVPLIKSIKTMPQRLLITKNIMPKPFFNFFPTSVLKKEVHF